MSIDFSRNKFHPVQFNLNLAAFLVHAFIATSNKYGFYC